MATKTVDDVRAKVKGTKGAKVRDNALKCEGLVAQILDDCMRNEFVEDYVNKILQNKQSKKPEKPEESFKEFPEKRFWQSNKKYQKKMDEYEKYFDKKIKETTSKEVNAKDLTVLFDINVNKAKMEINPGDYRIGGVNLEKDAGFLADGLNDALDELIKNPAFKDVNDTDLDKIRKNSIRFAGEITVEGSRVPDSSKGIKNITEKADRITPGGNRMPVKNEGIKKITDRAKMM